MRRARQIVHTGLLKRSLSILLKQHWTAGAFPKYLSGMSREHFSGLVWDLCFFRLSHEVRLESELSIVTTGSP